MSEKLQAWVVWVGKGYPIKCFLEKKEAIEYAGLMTERFNERVFFKTLLCAVLTIGDNDYSDEARKSFMCALEEIVI
jgi:hypothetical protein